MSVCDCVCVCQNDSCNSLERVCRHDVSFLIHSNAGVLRSPVPLALNGWSWSYSTRLDAALAFWAENQSSNTVLYCTAAPHRRISGGRLLGPEQSRSVAHLWGREPLIPTDPLFRLRVRVHVHAATRCNPLNPLNEKQQADEEKWREVATSSFYEHIALAVCSTFIVMLCSSPKRRIPIAEPVSASLRGH